MMNVGHLPPELARLVSAQTAGERHIWIGRPDSARILRQGLWTYLFSVPWTLFALGWTSVPVSVLLFAKTSDPWGGWGVGAMTVAALFGVPFIAAGFYMMHVPIKAYRLARHSVIVLTDRRLAILSDGKTREARTIPFAAITGVELKVRREGYGDVTVKLGSRRDSDGDKVEVNEMLIGIGDPEGLERALRQQIAPRAAT